MADRYFNQFLLTPTKRQVMLTGVISLSSAAAVTGETLPFATVAKTGTGTYTITLNDTYQQMRSCQLTMLTTEDALARIKSHAVSSTKTVVIETVTAGTVADVTAVAEVHVTLLFKDSSVGE